MMGKGRMVSLCVCLFWFIQVISVYGRSFTPQSESLLDNQSLDDHDISSNYKNINGKLVGAEGFPLDDNEWREERYAILLYRLSIKCKKILCWERGS
jgi:hypothetical protein